MAVNQSIKALKGYLDKTYKESETKKYISWSSLESGFIERIPTGSLLLDDVFGGGFIRSGLYQFFGGEGGGKSTVVSFIAAAYQQKGLPVLYIDAENKFQPEYTLATTGFNVMDENLCLFSQEEEASVIYDMIEKAAMNGFGLCVVDSTDAMMTPAQMNSEYGEQQMMQHARFHSESLRKIKGICNRNKCAVIFISQSRTHMVQGGGSYEETSGGKAIKFYCLSRNKVRRVKVLEDKDTGNARGVEIEIKNVKNQGGIPYKTCELTILFNKGIDTFNEAIDLAIQYDVIHKKGGWFEYSAFGEKPLQGREKVIAWFRENPAEYDILWKATEQAMKDAKNKVNLKDITVQEEDMEVASEVEEDLEKTASDASDDVTEEVPRRGQGRGKK